MSLEQGTFVEDSEPSPDVEEYYGDLNYYVRMVATGQSNALMLNAPAGLGKSFQIKETLRDEVDEHGFIEKSGYSTPLELYHTLYDAQEDTVLFLDDIEGLLDNDRALSLLKAATWDEDGGSRTVSWDSTTDKLEVPQEFEFDGRIIACFNDVPEDDPIFDSLRSRCLYYELDFSHQERMSIITEIAKAPHDDLDLDERQQVADWLVRNMTPEMDHIDLRTLMHAFDLYAFDPDEWDERARSLFDMEGSEVGLVRRLLEKHDTTRDAIKEYTEETGKKRRTFFNRKKELEERSGVEY